MLLPIFTPEFEVNAGKNCKTPTRYSDGSPGGAGCDYKWRPCAACAEAKVKAAEDRIAKDKLFLGEWLKGMQAREARVLQVRREMRWSASQYPTDREALEKCTSGEE